jgi:ribosomal protein S18 acetylase RimI-like enzyme
MEVSAKYLEFCRKFPRKPQIPESMLKRFLGELLSSQKLIFELSDGKGIYALAVLLDQVQNPANDACLEILGMRDDVQEGPVIDKFIEMAIDHCPVHRSGFQVGFHESSELTEEHLKSLGLKHYYDTYVMRKNDLLSVQELKESHIVRAMMDDLDEIYPVLSKAFAETPDTSIPGEESWKQGFIHSSNSHFYIWKEKGEILGFSNLILGDNGEEAELRTLGVLPTARSKGIGAKLLHRALYEAKLLGFPAIHLSVSVSNEGALGLYFQAGFKTFEKYKTYRMAI